MTDATDVSQEATAAPNANVKRPSRKRLRFAKVGYRAVPPGFMNLDKAVDQVGRQLYPDVWDKIIKNRGFPFQYVRERRQFFQYKFASNSIRPLIVKKLQPRNLDLGKNWKLADRVYKKVRSHIKDALEAGQIDSRVYTPDGEFLEVPRNAIAAQMRRIFYCGVMWIETSLGGRNFRVLLGKESFHRWLDPEYAASVKPRRMQKVGYSKFLPLLPVIAADAKENVII